MQPGTALGAYRIERELGSGGMGKVYAATSGESARAVAPGVTVALKVVHPHLLESPGFFKRFLREAEIGQTVRHPNVVRTLDCDAIDGTHFLAMEYVEGQTLRALLDEMETVPEELCRHIGREVSKGLAAIHAAGVVHRDMKPENVLITSDHVVKVMDLGVARLMDEAVRLSQTGAFVGSVHYAAPEQFSGGGESIDARADLHALGLVLYELSTGRHPFLADSVPEIVGHVLGTEPRKIGDVNPQLSAFFEEVVHRLLLKDPRGRFADAAELLGVLEGGESSRWWHARARSIQATTRRPIRRIRIPRETAVHGREKELAQLRALYDTARAGEGAVVLIEGEAGIGKSRLVDELVGRLQRDGGDLDFLFGSYPPGGAATAAGGFSTAFREQFGEAGSRPYLTSTPVLVPAFDALLCGETTPKGEEPLTKDSLQTCFVNAARALGAERPTVILIDDLHFAPEEGRALFSALAMAVPGHRVLLLGTARPGMPQDWLTGVTRLDHAHHVELSRLGPKDLGELLRDTLRSEQLARDLALQIGTKSDGNPFFVFEILRGLREGQFLTQQADGSWVTTSVIAEIQIPSSVRDLVSARVADLEGDERHLLDIAACWGFEFDPALVGAVLGLQRIPVLHAFGRIERRHRLARSAGRNYVFDHHQVQEALYGALNEQLREEYHGALAEALESRAHAASKDPDALNGALCVDLCEHLLKGARGDQALRYLPAAQAHLSSGYLHAESLALTERALAIDGLLTGAERARTLVRLAGADGPLAMLGRRQRQEECAREAEQLAEEAGDAELRGAAAAALGACFTRTARYADAETALGCALEVALARGDRTAEAAAAGGLGALFLGQHRFPEARAQLERQLELSREIGDPKGESKATGNLGIVFSAEGRNEQALEYLQRDLALCRERGDRRGEAGTAGNLGTVLWSQGRVTQAREFFERSLALDRTTGDRDGEANSTGNLGLLMLSLGRMPEACEQLERTLALMREIGDRQGEAVVLFNLGNVLAEERDTSPAQERLTACLALSERIGFQIMVAASQLLLGCLRVAARDAEDGRNRLVAARDVAVANDCQAQEAVARCELACLPGGDIADALAAYASHHDRLTTGQRREALWALFRATGERTHLEEAKRLLDELVAPVDDETRTAMVTNLRLHRGIMAAWNEHGGAAGAE